jgi:hypothetical protein
VNAPAPPHAAPRNPTPAGAFPPEPKREVSMKGIFAWLIGIPIPIIILLYLFHVF